jgi:hypothetical protein
MKTAAITFLTLLLPLPALAERVELTLNCQYESQLDVIKNQQGSASGSFSAIVRMQTLKDGTPYAMIEATTSPCFNYVGSYTELEVSGDCERTITSGGSVEKNRSFLKIDRISGAFRYDQLFGSSKASLSYVWYYGHCTPGKKLF